VVSIHGPLSYEPNAIPLCYPVGDILRNGHAVFNFFSFYLILSKYSPVTLLLLIDFLKKNIYYLRMFNIPFKKNRANMAFIITGIIAVLIGTTYTINTIQQLKYPKILWIYWDSDKLPDTIQQIKDYNRSRLIGWDVRFLNKNTLKKYIPEHAYNPKYNNLVSANKSDWIRLYIIYHYGGCWMDAGIIVNKGEALDSIYEQSVSKGVELTVFKNVKPGSTFKHSSGIELPLVIDSWFILAPKQSDIVKLWLNEFDKAIEIGFLNYKRALIKGGTDISKIYSANPDDTYLMVHMCIQHVLQKKAPVLPLIMMLDAKTSMLKLQNDCKWDDKCLADKLNNDPDSKRLPFIKLTSANRTHSIDKFFS
jgi:hypothetical protein